MKQYKCSQQEPCLLATGQQHTFITGRNGCIGDGCVWADASLWQALVYLKGLTPAPFFAKPAHHLGQA